MGDASFDSSVIASNTPQKETFFQKPFFQKLQRYFKLRILVPVLVFLALLIGLPASIYLAQTKQDLRNYAAFQTPESQNETIDTLSYFLGSSASHHLDGTTGGINLSSDLSQKVAYYVKWASNRYEYYRWDNDYIYLVRDTSWGDAGPFPDATNYTYDNGRWMKRYMNVGETVSASPNKLSCFTDACTPCSGNPGWSHTFENKLVQHISAFDTTADPDSSGQSDIGIQDVIVLQYGIGTKYEKFYYSKQYGFIKWEAWNDGNRTQFAVWYKTSGGFKAAAPMCGDASVGVTAPTGGGGSEPTPIGGAGKPLTVRVVQKGSGEKYNNSITVVNLYTEVCQGGCNSSCGDAICPGGVYQTYSLNGCNGLGCAKFANFTPNKGYYITLCTTDQSKCAGKVSLPKGWKITNYGCGSTSSLFTPTKSNDSCTIEVERPKVDLQGYIYLDSATSPNAVKNAEDKEPSLSGITLSLLKNTTTGDKTVVANTLSSQGSANRNYKIQNTPTGSYEFQLSNNSGYSLVDCSAIVSPKNVPTDYHFFYCMENGVQQLMRWTPKNKNFAYKKVNDNLLNLSENTIVDFPMRQISFVSPTVTLTP